MFLRTVSIPSIEVWYSNTKQNLLRVSIHPHPGVNRNIPFIFKNYIFNILLNQITLHYVKPEVQIQVLILTTSDSGNCTRFYNTSFTEKCFYSTPFDGTEIDSDQEKFKKKTSLHA